MKISVLLFLFFISTLLKAQGTDELLVYAVKGNAYVLEDRKETVLKIGRILRPGSLVRTFKETRLTLVCNQGKPILIQNEGDYAVSGWRDSCLLPHNSVTKNYFQYIWNQFYLRSPGHDPAKSKTNVVSGNGAVLRSEGETVRKVKIEFSPLLDTVNYSEGDFPLTWNSPDYEGKFLFQLFNTKGGKLVFKDSVSGNRIWISKFKKYLVAGRSYRWIIGTKGASVRKARTINVVAPPVLQKYLTEIDSLDIPEDSAANCFRKGYMLEQRHFYAQAYAYYKRAAALDPETGFFKDQLDYFIKEFRLSSSMSMSAYNWNGRENGR